MQLIHSLWTFPLSYNRWNVKKQYEKSLHLYKLSFLYAKKLGYEIVLHTDDVGYELLKSIDYNRIELSLNDLDKKNFNFWSLGKIKSLEIEGVNSIHIDGDVFLKSENIKNIFNENFSVLTQMIEPEKLFNDNYLPQLNFINSISDLLKSDIRFSYNCGVLCFKDWELFETYKNYINDIIDFYHRNTILERFYKNSSNFYERMLITEQYSLPIVVRKMKKKAKFIINDHKNINAECEHYGFAHAFGRIKYSDSFQAHIIKKINELEKEIF